ncbi:MAG: DNA polymerase Y family protein [Neomegalonema sp.]|nr:DNA polymerase Y family protein [Neomegalonema sp.]
MPAGPEARGGRRALVLWLPEAAADLALRRAPNLAGAPLAILADQRNARVIVGLSATAETAGLSHGAAAADARALQPGLISRPLDPAALARLAEGLRRWLGRYSPWIGREEHSPGPRSDLSFTLDVTGCAHLFHGEAALLEDMLARLERLGLRARAAIAESKGGAWALARYGVETNQPPFSDRAFIAPPGQLRACLADLPPTALRLCQETADGLARLGIRRIEDVAAIPRAALARRFGAPLCRRLDQAFGVEPEPIAPPPPPFRAAIRLAFPEPIGLLDDLRAGLARLLARLVERLDAAGLDARKLLLELRRVDRSDQRLEVGLAAPSRDAAQMLRLFEHGLEGVQAGYGIDAMRLVAREVEPRATTQHAALAPKTMFTSGETTNDAAAETAALTEVLSHIGGRFGFDRLTRYVKADSHLPEKGFYLRSAAEPRAEEANWRAAARARPPRPLIGFAPEPIAVTEAGVERRPPAVFRWRGAEHKVAAAFGPERITPEWWLDDPAWRSGVRDYWRVETTAGRRIWLFRLAQAPEPAWFAAGRFA